MAVFTVTTGVVDDETDATSFAEALALANGSAEADTIRFAADVESVRFNESFGINAAGGQLTIDGDHNGDFVSDVMFLAVNLNSHLVVQSGTTVEIRNVDFVGGYDKKYNAAPKGESGEDGSNASDPGYSGYDGNDGLNDATGGGEGGRGDDGLDSVGSIHNFGDLTLVRVGFGMKSAIGQPGARGGDGGVGGDSWGRSGTASADMLGGYPGAEYDEDDNPIFAPDNPRDPPESGIGGDAGTGATGGVGGRGGDSGDAAGAILNENGAILRLQDVVFGGRLSSGFVSAGNEAKGGKAGIGGVGGWGGHANGGNGADSVSDWVRLDAAVYYGENDNINVAWFLDFISSAAGTGGNGGVGGTGGQGGPGGVAGDAGTILNLGTVSGQAAFSDHNETGNKVHAGEQNLGSGGGDGGFNRKGNGGRQKIDWSEWTGEGIFNSVAQSEPGFQAHVAAYEYVRSWLGPRQLYDGTTAEDGVVVEEGARGANGNNGVAGSFDKQIMDKGSSTAETGNSLVFFWPVAAKSLRAAR